MLYGQEVLGTSVLEFAIYSTAAAVGGVVGGWTASAVSKRIGSGASLGTCLWGGAVVLDRHRARVGLAAGGACCCSSTVFTAVLWNVITVSLRQTIIPDRLLGRVNSVYRFFGWGAIPIGGLIGGVMVAVLDGPLSRENALRAPWIVAGVAQLVLAAVVGRTPHLAAHRQRSRRR